MTTYKLITRKVSCYKVISLYVLINVRISCYNVKNILHLTIKCSRYNLIQIFLSWCGYGYSHHVTMQANAFSVYLQNTE